MYRNASVLDLKCRKLLCQSLLQSHFDYAYIIWYRSMDKCLKIKLQSAQNTMIRYMLGYSSRHHLEHSDFSSLNCLNVLVPTRIDYLTLNVMLNIYHRSAPTYLYSVNSIKHCHHL